MTAEIERAKLALRVRAKEYEASDDLDEAIRHWRALMQLPTNDPLRGVAVARVADLTRQLRAKEQAQAILALDQRAIDTALREAEERGRYTLIVAIRRAQAAERGTATALTALASALRRAGARTEAAKVLTESLALDPSRRSNRAAHTVQGALLRDAGKRSEARALLERLHDEAPGDPFVAAALAGVYLDYVEYHGLTDLLPDAHRLSGIVYARDPSSREVRALYGRHDSLARRTDMV